jgi:tetratricopeptide (TPR) repeat protein
MAFDPFSWALGFALTSAAKKLAGWFRQDASVQAFRTAVITWQQSLPEGCDVHLEILFPVATGAEGRGPARDALAIELQANHVPSVSVWLEALLEQWRETRALADLDEAWTFFEMAEEEAGEHLQRLAEALHDACGGDMARLGPHLLKESRTRQQLEQALGPALHPAVATSFMVAVESGSAVKEINAAVDRLKNGDLSAARDSLSELRRSAWGRLDSVEKYRVLANLGIIDVRTGAPDEAARKFLEAHDFSPENEKARLFRVWAFYLRGENARAHELATELRRAFPAMSGATALWIRTAPSETTVESLRREIEDHILEHGEVASALAERACRRRDFSSAELWLRNSVSKEPDNADALQLLAQILVSRAAEPAVIDGPHAVEREQVVEARGYLSRAFELLSKEENFDRLATAHVELANCHLLLGDDVEARRHVKAAWAKEVRTVEARSRRAQLSLGLVDDEVLIDELKDLVQAPDVPEFVHLVYALALRRRGSTEDVRTAADILSHGLVLSATDALLREDALDLAIQLLGRSEKFGEAEELLHEVDRTGASLPVVVATLLGELSLERGETERAATAAGKAASAVTSETPLRWTARLARIFLELGDAKSAFEMLRNLAPGATLRAVDTDLVNAAEGAGEHPFLAQYCRRLRDLGIASAWVVEREIVALAAGANTLEH